MTCSATRPTAARRRTTRLAASLALVVAMTGCGLVGREATLTEPVARTGPITIGFSPINLTTPLLRDLGKGLESYAASKGALALVADPRNNAATQVRQLDAWIEGDRVQAIWAIAVDAAALRPVFERAREKGIAVLATGTPEDYGQATLGPSWSYSYIDYRSYGREAGKVLGACAEERLKGRARVLHVQNPPTTIGADDYAAGLREGLIAASPGSAIVASGDSGSDEVVSAEVTSSALQADSTINAVVGANEAALAGAQRAYDEADREGESSCIVGSGGNDESLAAVRDGTLYAVVALKYKEDLAQNVDQMLQMVADPQAVGMQLLTPIETITG